MFNGFLFLLGDFDPYEFAASSSYGLTLGLFIIFMFFINIVMLNLLIAIMGDIFDRVQENARSEFICARAQVILEIEGRLLTGPGKDIHKADKKKFPTWLQLLVSTVKEDTAEEHGWAGRVKALKLAVKRVEDKLEESEKRLKATENRREQDKAELMAKLDEISKKGEGATHMSQEMLKMLCADYEPKEKRKRTLEYENFTLVEELGENIEDIKKQMEEGTGQVPHAEELNWKLKSLKAEREKLNKDVEDLWAKLR